MSGATLTPPQSFQIDLPPLPAFFGQALAALELALPELLAALELALPELLAALVRALPPLLLPRRSQLTLHRVPRDAQVLTTALLAALVLLELSHRSAVVLRLACPL